MSLRDELLAMGLSPKELNEAIQESRRTVRSVQRGADYLSIIFKKLQKQFPPGSKVQFPAFIGQAVAERVRDGAATLLQPMRGKKP